jgi:hypothetical protein
MGVQTVVEVTVAVAEVVPGGIAVMLIYPVSENDVGTPSLSDSCMAERLERKGSGLEIEVIDMVVVILVNQL